MKIQNKEKMVKKNIDSGEKNQESIPKIMFKKILNQESNMKRIKIHNKNTVRQFHSTKQELLMKTKIQNSMNQESTMSTKVNNLKQSFGKTKHRAIMPFVFIFSMFLLLFNCPRIIEPGPEQPLVIPLTTNAMDVLDASNALQINYASGDTNSNVTKNITLATNDIEKKVAISWKSSATSVISISNATGVVYRKKANANVTLTASLNKGDYTNTKIFLLTVVGDNTRPRFTTLLTFSVNENISNDAVVGTVVATDDVGGTGVIAYAITDGNDGDVFAIDINGVLTIVGDIDYENINRYTLSIQVIDAADNRATGTFTVNVINIDDTAPVIAANQLFFVEENVSNGTVVATDDEAGGTGVIAYEIIDGNFGDLFAIDNNGQLTAAGAIDRENTASHTLVVRVSDANSNMDTATITVNVINVDDSPPIIVAQSFPVDENVPVGTVVGRVDANDNPGGSGIVSFQITAGILEMPLPLITMGS